MLILIGIDYSYKNIKRLQRKKKNKNIRNIHVGPEHIPSIRSIYRVYAQDHIYSKSNIILNHFIFYYKFL